VKAHTIRFEVTAGEAQLRLDKAVTERLADLSRARVQALIEAGHVHVNGRAGRPASRLNAGDRVEIWLDEQIVTPDFGTHTPSEAIPLDVIYEDTVIVGINKPAGMVMYPAPGHTTGTLVNAILARWPSVASVGGENRAGIVHRLDKDTSGAVVVAKSEAARLDLMTQFEQREVKKRYLALVTGVPQRPQGIINAPLGPDAKKMAVQTRGVPAVTEYRVIERFGTAYALIEALPQTGRTHQIRVHLAHLGYPLVGDTLYGGQDTRFGLNRHFLHAELLALRTPESGAAILLHAPLAPELKAIIQDLRTHP
jgi:23S rRNA pseudouridine1911/1915/1917 synthase